MKAPTTVLTGSTNIVVESGSLQGTVVTTTASFVNLTASVPVGKILSLGPYAGVGVMTLYGTVTVVGTINVYAFVLVDGSTILGNGGTGVIVLDECTCNSGTGSVNAATICKYLEQYRIVVYLIDR